LIGSGKDYNISISSKDFKNEERVEVSLLVLTPIPPWWETTQGNRELGFQKMVVLLPCLENPKWRGG
jgi:hypothetical protein